MLQIKLWYFIYMIDEFRGVKTRVIVEKYILRALIEAKLLYMECIQYKNWHAING